MQPVIDSSGGVPFWLLLAIGFVCGTIFAASRGGRGEPIRSAFKFLLLIAVLVAVIHCLTHSTLRLLPEANSAVTGVARPSPPPIPAVVTSHETSLNSERHATPSLSASTAPPAWTQQPRQVDGKRTWLVVKSGRFASLEEAERIAFDEAVTAVTREFRELDPRGSGDRAASHVDLVRLSAVRQRFDEVVEHDFGKFKAPMYQVWLQLELTPELGEQIAAPWRQAAVEARLKALSGWGLWSTAVAALVAFALRLDAAWTGRRRAAVVTTTIALALGSLLFFA